MKNEQTVHVLIVDDTAMYRLILDRAVSQIQDTAVVGTAANGEIALQKLATSMVDLVLVDVFMPGMSGIETLQKIREKYPDIAVAMVSGVATSDAEITIQALNMGALDFVSKPKEKNAEESMRTLVEELKRVINAVRARGLVREKKVELKPTVSAPVLPRPSIKLAKIDLVVIGVSTGGPNALGVVIPSLPQNLPCPVLLVQHMPPIFTASLADHLSKKSALQVREGIENESIAPGTVWIAPGGKHMTIKHHPHDPSKYVLALDESPPVNSCRPAVDVLFNSVASIFHGGVLAVILTGMGEDGANGTASLKHQHCYCLAQDEKTCVVYGMPRAIAERHLADEVLPLDHIAPRIASLTGCS
ncbi:MAG: chemotaxis-specific protein-glutamate methyltransferase CheB [Verrucomicrobiota bacterium]